jgi:SAM-dependent methyltransferase
VSAGDLVQSANSAIESDDLETALHLLKQVFDIAPNFRSTDAARYVASFLAEDRRRFWRVPRKLIPDPEDLKATFETIYRSNLWGRGSGLGSDLRSTILYVAYVQHLIGRCNVRTIVDLGCGDWQFSKYLDLKGCAYLGVDIVASVIAANIAAYARDNIRFENADITSFEVPECDLLLCKDVMQHLTNGNVRSILDRRHAAQIALFTNDYHPANEDSPSGSTRPLDITAPPFSVAAIPRLAFSGKVTFLVTRKDGTKPETPVRVVKDKT